jgi:hypothetical protein
MKKKKQKFATGGNVRHYIETPAQAMLEYDISLARAQEKAESNGWAQGIGMFGNILMQTGMSQAGGLGGVIKGVGQGAKLLSGGELPTAALGGTVKGSKVEVEGGEVAETPDGQLIEFEGPSHKKGGINTMLEFDTDIYSKQVKGPDGKAMADRKLAREKKETKISKLSEKSPTDRLLQKTLERTKSNNMITDKKDMQKMEMVRLLIGANKKFALGGNTGFPIIDFEFIESVIARQKVADTGIAQGKYDGFSDVKATLPDLTDKIAGNKAVADLAAKGGEESPWESILSGLGNTTGGDLLGMYGQFKSGTDPLKSTLKNRGKDTPNINAFEDYGNDALDVNEETQGYVAGQRNNALKDIERTSVGAKNANRNTARGVNTMRGLDFASDVAGDQSRERVYDDFSKMMMGILGQKSTLENDQDLRVMTGEQGRDLSDRMDKDNFYSQMAEDLATKNLMTQHMGKNLNSMKERDVKMNLINQLSEYGLTLDNQGNIVGMTKKK